MKKIFLFPLGIILMIGLLVGCLISSNDDDDRIYSFKVKNDTTENFTKLNYREHGTTSWTSKNATFTAGGSPVEIDLSYYLDSNKRYDLQLERTVNYSEKVTATKYNIPLYQNGLVEFVGADLDGDRIGSIWIVNSTDRQYDRVYIGLAGSASSNSWSHPDIHLTIPAHSRVLLSNINPELYVSRTYDVQLRNVSSGMRITRYSVSLNSREVEFQ